MSIKETIARLEEMADDREDKILPGCIGWDEIEPLREAAALLRTHPDAQPNEPLTEVEVEEYEGKPLWFERPSLNHCSGGKWEIVDGVNTYDHVIILRGGKIVSGYGLDAVAYRRPPKEA